MKRIAALVMPAAVTVSDRTCEAVFGVSWRPLREFAISRGVPIEHIGRRPIVRVADVLAALNGDRSASPHWDEEEIVARAARGAR